MPAMIAGVQPGKARDFTGMILFCLHGRRLLLLSILQT